ncbi:hypothetical protein [Pseudolabrys sp. FHR47]|uniref:hypothetical protein n=1 Tax=Pseudolabrys sp. FHR47 TaxID=2562284 RepID=UPI0010BEEFA3|nr:hypothetical protein [Pseudolabrys sp. FHR47]
MNFAHTDDGCFDDSALLVMGAAFDQACLSLRHLSRDYQTRELLALRIIGAAIRGERDPIRLCSYAMIGFHVDDRPKLMTAQAYLPPSPVCAAVARVA